MSYRKYWKTAALAATAFLGDSPLFLMDYLLRFLRVAVLLSIWRAILTGRGVTAGMTIGSVLTYTLVAEVFAEQLACRTGLDEAIWEGSIAARFLRPWGRWRSLPRRHSGAGGSALPPSRFPCCFARPC